MCIIIPNSIPSAMEAEKRRSDAGARPSSSLLAARRADKSAAPISINREGDILSNGKIIHPDVWFASESAPRPMAGFLATLTPEGRKAALEYDGPETHGDPAFVMPGRPFE